MEYQENYKRSEYHEFSLNGEVPVTEIVLRVFQNCINVLR